MLIYLKATKMENQSLYCVSFGSVFLQHQKQHRYYDRPQQNMENNNNNNNISSNNRSIIITIKKQQLPQHHLIKNKSNKIENNNKQPWPLFSSAGAPFFDQLTRHLLPQKYPASNFPFPIILLISRTKK